METFPITSDQIESSCNRIVESRGLSSSFNQRCGEKEFAENLHTNIGIERELYKLCIVNFPSEPRGKAAAEGFHFLFCF